MPIELIVLIVTLLLLGVTWLLYRLSDRLRSRP